MPKVRMWQSTSGLLVGISVRPEAVMLPDTRSYHEQRHQGSFSSSTLESQFGLRRTLKVADIGIRLRPPFELILASARLVVASFA